MADDDSAVFFDAVSQHDGFEVSNPLFVGGEDGTESAVAHASADDNLVEAPAPVGHINDLNIVAAVTTHGNVEADIDETAVASIAATKHDTSEEEVHEAAVPSEAAATHDPLEADVDVATIASVVDRNNVAAAANHDPLEDEVIVAPAEDKEVAFQLVSNNPVRIIQPKKRWKRAAVLDSHNADNFSPLLQYLCQLSDFPHCFDRQNRRFVKCSCFKKMSPENLEIVAHSIGELFIFF